MAVSTMKALRYFARAQERAEMARQDNYDGHLFFVFHYSKLIANALCGND